MFIDLKYIMFLFLFGLISCGDDDKKVKCKYKFFTSGLNVCSEEFVDVNEIYYSVSIIEEKTAEVYPQVSNLPETFENNNLNLYIVNSPLATDCEKIDEGTYRCDVVANGINVGSTNIYVRYSECLAFIPIGHELLHSIEALYLTDVFKKDHMTPKLFTYGSGSNSVEAEIFRELIFNLPSCVDDAERYR